MRPKTTVTGEFFGEIPVTITESNVMTSLVVMTRISDVSLTANEDDVPVALVHVIVVSEDHLVISLAVGLILDRRVLSKYPKFTAAIEFRSDAAKVGRDSSTPPRHIDLGKNVPMSAPPGSPARHAG